MAIRGRHHPNDIEHHSRRRGSIHLHYTGNHIGHVWCEGEDVETSSRSDYIAETSGNGGSSGDSASLEAEFEFTEDVGGGNDKEREVWFYEHTTWFHAYKKLTFSYIASWCEVYHEGQSDVFELVAIINENDVGEKGATTTSATGKLPKAIFTPLLKQQCITLDEVLGCVDVEEMEQGEQVTMSDTRGPHTGAAVGKGKAPTAAPIEKKTETISIPIVEKHSAAVEVEKWGSLTNIAKHLKRIVRPRRATQTCVAIHKSKRKAWSQATALRRYSATALSSIELQLLKDLRAKCRKSKKGGEEWSMKLPELKPHHICANHLEGLIYYGVGDDAVKYCIAGFVIDLYIGLPYERQEKYPTQCWKSIFLPGHDKVFMPLQKSCKGNTNYFLLLICGTSVTWSSTQPLPWEMSTQKAFCAAPYVRDKCLLSILQGKSTHFPKALQGMCAFIVVRVGI
ncbi:hypothetical protein Cgig2_011138 [Carnegiea gigantea]|uniref:Uncharacterized protein n=1 Tax=Carnegiea gigantea TaxID=171969 RepID=A0A9Q1GWS4_9CARY|nr:hypothetical protein Cgig2_011138 [Carnegiea gigantea]